MTDQLTRLQMSSADSDYYEGLLAEAVTPKDIPADVAAAIKAMPARQNLDFVNLVQISDQVVKAETIRFADKATVLLQGLAHPWIALVTRELVIASPDARALITRPAGPAAELEFARTLRGADGADKPRAPNGAGYGPHRHGEPGANGQDGDAGEPGRTQSLPVLYIIAGRVRWGTTPQTPPRPAIVVMYDGIDGGHGGQGGDGGRGGDGHAGADGDSNVWNCRHGPANGGDGGFGGRGGRGGDAGRGGDGGSAILVSPTSVISDFILVRQEPGDPGIAGAAGVSGTGGSGGQGGRPRGHCHGNGSNGANRSAERPTAFGPGADNIKGKRGLKEYIARTVDDLFA